MKLLGATLILCAAALVCHALLAERRRERETLRELSAALESLEREVRASLTPLPRLLARRGYGQYADAFFAAMLECGELPLPERWRAAALSLPLSPREREVVARPASALGGEEDDLLRALRAAATELRRALEEKERARAGETRLITSLAFSLGLLLTILLI